jgi:acetylornithine deacetylase/succinyl-diaminopimelate desuccinylase-like protein
MDENRRILIEDWYEGIWQLGPDDEEQLRDKASRSTSKAMKDEWGIEEFALGRDGIDAVRARTYEPTANIQGLIAGYTALAQNDRPERARARLDFRLIPNIQPDAAIRKLKAHLVKHGFGHIEVRPSMGPSRPTRSRSRRT